MYFTIIVTANIFFQRGVEWEEERVETRILEGWWWGGKHGEGGKAQLFGGSPFGACALRTTAGLNS